MSKRDYLGELENEITAIENYCTEFDNFEERVLAGLTELEPPVLPVSTRKATAYANKRIKHFERAVRAFKRVYQAPKPKDE